MSKLIMISAGTYNRLRELRDKDHSTFGAVIDKMLLMYGSPYEAITMPTHSDK